MGAGGSLVRYQRVLLLQRNEWHQRHLAVDILGFPFFTPCTLANRSDDAGLIELLMQNIDYFRSKPVNLPKITILVDHGYHPNVLKKALEQVYPQIMGRPQGQRQAERADGQGKRILQYFRNKTPQSWSYCENIGILQAADR